jgi:nucleotide-binding universal stress UspA family protein
VPGDVARFVPGQTLEDYHRERSDKALAPARQMLDAAGLAHQDVQRVGDPGPTIAQTARELGSDLIVMGARGLATHTAALLGSVAQATIEQRRGAGAGGQVAERWTSPPAFSGRRSARSSSPTSCCRATTPW